MSFYQRYLNGEYSQVYADIARLRQKAFQPEAAAEIDRLLTETFRRVLHNANIVAETLPQFGYRFNRWRDNVITPPLPTADEYIRHLVQAVQPVGFIPLSLQYFYRIVGEINFIWDYDGYPEIVWEYADPLCVYGIDFVLEEMENEDNEWLECTRELLAENPKCPIGLPFSPDDYHKDNVSGGNAYEIALSTKPSVDGKVLYAPQNTQFIAYLRHIFANGGFGSEVDAPEFQDYLQTVLPKLLPF